VIAAILGLALAAGSAAPPPSAPIVAPAPAVTAAAAPADSAAAPDSTAHGTAAPAAADSVAARLGFAPVVRMRRSGGLVLAGEGAAAIEPQGIAFDSFGRAYVSDRALRRLVQFDPDGRRLWEAGALGDDPGKLRRPGPVVPAGVLAMGVLDEENRRVVLYDLFGRFQSVRVDLDPVLDAAGAGRSRPVGLAADRGGALYVADAEQDRVLVFDATGALNRTIGGHGAGPGAFHGVAGVAVSRHGDVVVTERVGGRVQWLDPSGAPRAHWTLPRGTRGDRLPAAVDDSLRVAVADPAGGVVWLFDRDGRKLGGADGLAEPVALAFARDGSLWVAERGRRTITRFVLEDAHARTPPDDH
jgi:sugar lactone lactonase YvrE